jgi:hypothetical protein
MRTRFWVVLQPNFANSGSLRAITADRLLRSKPSAPVAGLVVEVELDVDDAWFSPKVSASLGAPASAGITIGVDDDEDY